MKIAIMGAGAMGSLYGGPLSEKNEVWLVDVWKQHIDTIKKDGLKIRVGGKDNTYHPNATVSADEAGAADLVVIFVKSINTADALRQNQALFGDHTMVLTLQNGYGNDEDILPYIKPENLFVGTTACGATTLGPGHVFQAGKGITRIGVVKSGDISRAGIIADALNSAGFETEVAPDVLNAIWEKLLVNTGLNAPLALLNVRNGFIGECPDALELARHLLAEGVSVARAEGFDMDGDYIVQHYYIEGSKVVGHNRCSMLQDVDNERKTEVEKINGAIVKLGRKYGIPTPFNEAMLLMIGAKEQSYHWE